MKKWGPWVVAAVLVAVAGGLRWRSERDKAAAAQAKQAAQAAFDAKLAAARSAEDQKSLELARAIRQFYPFARIADVAWEAEVECLKARPSAAAKCVATYDAELKKTRELAEAVPSTGPGCSGDAVRNGVLAALDKAIEENKLPPATSRMGVPFSDVHASFRDCVNRLFRVRTPDGPPTAAGAATYLGVRDDSPIPGPVKPGLLTVNGHEIEGTPN